MLLSFKIIRFYFDGVVWVDIVAVSCWNLNRKTEFYIKLNYYFSLDIHKLFSW